mmetsp:Transcript_2789/g.3983  ORF Transcript_2789/g.3983 Transcript_2789/m.3983 type:complete len:483 (-) Transcript_2789:56-1504(-)|eukprot:CAMPEP_0201696886 /NCGR_PEP_ID=MMETSP0578-20130828/8380_1 /ASSEMBLY_ACC=CAM_ASM_000663 /TAXON_ID=267565 /ORGANISM="Skeletonema grethea, Strain CCMP 1804" /LENGTH=482 /DNA_ID=CAMNT_0048182919 /DNA_START=174 /DNA_END=1622 /DNA_ORIENTATION=+
MTEVHIAIYDLSNGMARGLSAQFLGTQHAIDIIPHTAIVAFGKEYFFGQGIEMCHPQEFRMTRGIQPIDIQSLGHTSCTQSEFEAWCRAQGQGRFSPTSYDLLNRNCNNFTEEAAREGLRLGRGVPSWILEVPQRFLSSPMGMMIRPMLEQMQMTNAAPTNVSRQMNDVQSYTPAPTPAVAAAAANPWADIPETTTSPAPKQSDNVSPPETPFLDNQTALLSTDTGVVNLCLDRLNPASDQREILSKLGNAKFVWTHAELQSIHQILRSFMNETKQLSFALMLLRLAVMREAPSIITDDSQSTEFVADLLLKNKSVSMSTRSMAWCVLSNAFGSKQLPSWTKDENNQSDKFLQLIDRAVNDCEPTAADASAPSQKALRQSASAFLYNSSRRLTSGGTDGNSELTEAIMSILIGCLENLGEETDSTSVARRYMCIGQILKSRQFGTTAVDLTKELGMLDADMIRSASHDDAVEKVAKEVASLL